MQGPPICVWLGTRSSADSSTDTKPAGSSSQEADAAGMKCSTAETHTQACRHASTHTNIPACQHSHKHVHARMPAHARMPTHAHMPTHTQACRHANTHDSVRVLSSKHPLGQRSKVTCIGLKLGEIPTCSLAECQEGDRTGDCPNREDFSSCFSQNPKDFRLSSSPICCPSPPRRLS